jgi:ATP-binding cassette, subfamily C, bacteriocin exporter
MESFKPNSKNFILQKDQADCGVACLQNILRHKGVEISLEKLRELSGTNSFGTTLLGLCQAAEKIGFNAQGAEANTMNDLKKIKFPCILHTTIENLEHYIIFYNWDGNHFLLGDPGKGVIKMTEDELSIIWKSKVVLLLQPTEKLERNRHQYQKRWKWLFLIVKGYTTPLVITAVMGLIISILSLSTAIFSQKLIDRLLNKPDVTKVYISLLLLGMLLFLKGIINYVRGHILALQAKAFNIDITASFYEKLLKMPKLFFDNRKTGDMVARLNDTNRIQQTASSLIGEISIQILLLLVTVVIVFTYSTIAGLVGLLFVPAAFLLVRWFQPKILNCQRKTMVAHARNESNYIDNIKAIGIIKLFNKENYFFKESKTIFTGLQDTVFSMAKIRIKFNLAIEILATCFFIILTITGVFSVLHKQLGAGELIAILQLGGLLMQATVTIALANIQIQDAKLAFDRMYEFSNMESVEDAESYSSEREIISHLEPFNFETLQVKQLCFRFPGRKLLLNNINLCVKKGGIVAITGDSGEGKSSFFQLLQLFYKPTSGQILVNNEFINALDIVKWRKAVGVVTQHPVLFSGTVIDNIILKKTEPNDIEPVVKFCVNMGLHDYMLKLPQGYSTLVGEGGISISGGQMQLISLARCLYHQPQLLLLDEPTAAMDRKTEQFVIEMLQKIKPYCGIILISHKDTLTEIADAVYLLEQGALNEVKKHKPSIIAYS